MSDPLKNKWVLNRQKLAWEPEILITGVVLFGLIKLPDFLKDLSRHLNNSGPDIFYHSQLDEILIAFLGTSIIILIGGLIITLLMRSVWVVMIALSFLFPEGVDLEKFKLQPFYERKIRKSLYFNDFVGKLDKICSVLYTITFFLFMCVIGIVFFISVIGLSIMVIYAIFPLTTTADIWINTTLNVIVNVLVVLYLLDFITLGWFKRVRWLSKIYRPVYIIMSTLILAPLYRGIYYALISYFKRWRVSLGIVVFFLIVYFITGIQRGQGLFNTSELFSAKLEVGLIDGYYRDKTTVALSNWIHIQSAVIETNVLEVFVVHKVALEESIIASYSERSGKNKNEILSNDSLRLESLSNFYRFTIDGKTISPVPFMMMEYEQYDQNGMIGFIPLDSISSGQHTLGLYLNDSDKKMVAHLHFFKTN